MPRRLASHADFAPPDTRISTALKFIEAEYADPSLRLNTVARRVALSPWYLDKLLKKHTGGTFRDHLWRVRMRHAESLLRDGQVAIKEIAFSVGYKHASELDRAFKHYFACTPTDYRRCLGAQEGRATTVNS